MALRIVIYLQIVWIAVTGFLYRTNWPTPETRLIDVLLIGALYGFPAGVLGAVNQMELTWTRKCAILVVEAGLTIAYLIAILPGVQ